MAATKSTVKRLEDFGQSIWFDYLRRTFISGGDLQRLIDEDGLRGVTSNPAIFEKAIAGSTDYTEALQALERSKDQDAMTIYEHLAIPDIQKAADVLRPVYEETAGRDGYVSMEVSPYLAHDTDGSINEARRLWATIDRPNVMIKIPASAEGVPAIRQLIGEGLNINVTLLFGLEFYEQVVEAYISGLEQLAGQRSGDLGGVASVASFFVSRVDTAVDAAIQEKLKQGGGQAGTLKGLAGKVAIANAKLAYERYNQLFRGPRWEALARRGARTQRLLWASTGTKNPNYRDVLYIEELIGQDTVNTVPPATLDAFRDHGEPSATLDADVAAAHETIEALPRVGISLLQITDQLLEDGIVLFAQAFDKLLAAVDEQRISALGTCIDRQTYQLPDDMSSEVQKTLSEWRAAGTVRRLWALDASLWTNGDEARWLAWLGMTDDQLAHIGHLKRIAAEVRDGGFTHALLLGMGGSSLCPEVMANTFGRANGFPELRILDSTDSAQIKRTEQSVDLAKTLFIVSSKSGTTLEPNIYKDYFFQRAQEVLGADAASHFIAITDPGSQLQQVAEREGFRHIYFGVPGIGGRYSALSDFGMVPAAIGGIDVERFLDNAEVMVHSCAASVPPEDNPGAVLGVILGVAANHGRDKVTIIASPGISSLGAWLEQLLAESTGKNGKGLIPVDGEALGAPDVYGADRVFAYLRLESGPDQAQDAAIDLLEKAGHPVVRIAINEPYDVGQEFFHWEFATAVAGSVIGINAFDQPDVEASKDVTRSMTAAYEQTGALPSEAPVFEEDSITLFTDDRNAQALSSAVGGDRSLLRYLRAHLDRLGAGDYLGLLAYIDRNQAHDTQLQAMRLAVRDARRVATVVGFGPRFLHSTGQAYKGGPNSGVFLQITCDDAADLPVPGRKYSFGVVKAAQARGDFQVLAERGRRALRVHIHGDLEVGLVRLRAAVDQALVR